MTLEALLTMLREMILNDRSDRTSGTSDYLWSDETLVAYINEAQRRFAVQGLVLRDGSTNEVTRFALVEGQSEYVLHESVIGVMSARMQDQTVDLNRAGHGILNAYRAPTDNWIDPGAFQSLPPGSPLAFSTDEGLQAQAQDSLSQITFRVHPTPAAAQDGLYVRMRVIRKPLDSLVPTQLQAVPEIPEDHHIEMLDWAAYLALRIVDDDAGAAKVAENYRNSFDGHVKEARNTLMRKMFAPIDWGFGRGGFAWSH